MAYKVRSAAFNVYRKGSLQKQKAALRKLMRKSDVISLSEVHDEDLIEFIRDLGWGTVRSGDDSVLIYDGGKFEQMDQGQETINQTEGSTGGMRSRRVAYALLRDKNTGEQFWQIAAHTTPPRQGSPAVRRKIRREQYNSISKIAKRLEERSGKPVIVAGDLNFKNPSMKGLTTITRGGVMHTAVTGAAKAKDTDRFNLPGADHKAVVTDFALKRGVSRVEGPEGRDQLSLKEIEREYGFGWKLIKSDPDLEELFSKAVAEGWPPDQLVAQLRDTKWFKKHSDVYRQNAALKFTDPATYKERLQNARDQIENLAGQWGADLTGKEISRYAERALMLGWSTEQILDHIARDVRPGKDGGFDGQLAGIEEQLKNTAHRNGVKIPKNQLQGWMRSIVKGEADVAEFDSYIRRVASQTFGAYSKELKAGVDLADIAAPYLQSMGEILELNPNELDMFDKNIRKAMSFRNEKGEFQPMSLTDFEDSLRRDNRWQYTDNARETMQGYALELGKLWGVV